MNSHTSANAPRPFVVGLVGLCAFTAACRGPVSTGTAQTSESGPRTVDIVRVVEQPLNVTLSMPAELEAYQRVAIYARVPGFVKTISVDRGSRVRAGDLLAVLEAPELVAQRSEAQSKLQAAEAQLSASRSRAEAGKGTFDRLKAAAETPGVVAGNDLVLAQKAMEADESQVAAARQNVEAARQALQSVTEIEGYLRVTAPFDGVVTERNVHPGALVGPNSGAGSATPLVEVVQDSRLRLVVPVPEAYIASVRAGTDVTFSVAAYPGESFSGRVARIAKAVDVRTRTMAVELDVVNTDERLSPGAFCQVRWPVGRPHPSMLVPSSSVASTTDRTFVVRIQDGKADWVDVKTGLATDGLVEVFGNLKAGDVVASRGTDDLRPGSEVHVRDVKPAAP